MNMHQLSVLMSAGLIAMAVFLLMQIDPRMPHLERPALTSAQRVSFVAMEVPEIRSFEHYYGGEKQAWRHKNPFVPFKVREAERQALQRETDRRPQVAQRPPVKLPEPPVAYDKPVIEPIEPVAVPALPGSAAQPPRVVAIVDGLDTLVLRVRKGEEEREMAPGDAIAGWTLEGVRDGAAWFIDPDGAEHRFPIGEGSSGVTVIAGGASAGAGNGPVDAPRDDPGAGSTDPRVQSLLRLLDASPKKEQLLRRFPNLRQRIRRNPQAVIDLLRENPDLLR